MLFYILTICFFYILNIFMNVLIDCLLEVGGKSLLFAHSSQLKSVGEASPGIFGWASCLGGVGHGLHPWAASERARNEQMVHTGGNWGSGILAESLVWPATSRHGQ